MSRDRRPGDPGDDDAARRARLEALFLACVDLPAAQRAAFLDAHCAGDPGLHLELEALLEYDAAPTAVSPAVGLAGVPAAAAGADEPLPRTVGAYRLVQRLGEGGFGEVFAAEQSTPVRRRVALKILKPGMDSRAVLARFEAERQALALMDHPGIAKVFDAGVTETGRPYFVMELVAGQSVTDYCDRHHLDVPARLALFMDVCRAIQHAHTKGVIHRDLKPSNILVVDGDGGPQPKVIDFGIAKATSGAPGADALSGEAPRTLQGEILGTPEYMSPEQASSRGADVDTRSDVWSLGVILYRLLTGRVPFAAERLRAGDIAQMHRVLAEEEPAKPSEAVGPAAGDVPPSTTARRLRGDLDWIVLRALEKDRERRYASPAALARDIERHLRDEPIEAGSPTTIDRVRKLVRRHRALVTGGAAVLVALVAGVVATTTQAVRARQAEDRARREATAARTVNEFLGRMLASGNPMEDAWGPELTLRQVVERAAEEVDAGPPATPEAEAGIRHALGTTFLGLGLYPQAEAQLDRAAALRAAEASPSRAALETHLEIARMNALRAHDEAADSMLTALEPDVIRLGGSDPALRARYLSLHGGALANLGRTAESDSLLTEALDLRRKLVAEAPADRAALAALGFALQDAAQVRKKQGRIDDAEALAREGLDVARRARGEGHFLVGSASVRLASVLKSAGRYAQAESLDADAVRIGEAALGPDHPVVAEWLSERSDVLRLQGRLEEAEAGLRRAREIMRRAGIEDTARGAKLLSNLANVVQQRGGLPEALELRRRVLAAQRATYGDDHETVATEWNNLGSTYLLMERFAEAEQAFETALATFARRGRSEGVDALVTTHNLGKARLLAGRAADAVETLRGADELGARILPETHPTRAVLSTTLARALAATGQVDEARARLTAAHEVLVAAFGPEHPRTREAEETLARLGP